MSKLLLLVVVFSAIFSCDALADFPRIEKVLENIQSLRESLSNGKIGKALHDTHVMFNYFDRLPDNKIVQLYKGTFDKLESLEKDIKFTAEDFGTLAEIPRLLIEKNPVDIIAFLKRSVEKGYVHGVAGVVGEIFDIMGPTTQHLEALSAEDFETMIKSLDELIDGDYLQEFSALAKAMLEETTALASELESIDDRTLSSILQDHQVEIFKTYYNSIKEFHEKLVYGITSLNTFLKLFTQDNAKESLQALNNATDGQLVGGISSLANQVLDVVDQAKMYLSIVSFLDSKDLIEQIDGPIIKPTLDEYLSKYELSQQQIESLQSMEKLFILMKANAEDDSGKKSNEINKVLDEIYKQRFVEL